VPEPERVAAGAPDLALAESRLLVEDPEPPPPAIGVLPLCPPLGVEVEGILRDGPDIDDQREVAASWSGGVELEVLAPAHVAPRRREDGRHRAPASLLGRGLPVPEGQIED